MWSISLSLSAGELLKNKIFTNYQHFYHILLQSELLGT